MKLLILGLLASGAAQGGEPAWREFHTLSDGRPGFEQVFSYDPASVRRRRHAVRAMLLSWQPIVEGEPVMVGSWRAGALRSTTSIKARDAGGRTSSGIRQGRSKAP